MAGWMRSVNEVIMIWWVGNDPIVKEANNWQQLAIFNLWTRRVWRTKDGEQREEVQYHKIAAWWKMAERVQNILWKWKKVYLRGYLHNRKVEIEWEEKPRIITEVVMNDLLILTPKRTTGQQDDQSESDWDWQSSEDEQQVE